MTNELVKNPAGFSTAIKKYFRSASNLVNKCKTSLLFRASWTQTLGDPTESAPGGVSQLVLWIPVSRSFLRSTNLPYQRFTLDGRVGGKGLCCPGGGVGRALLSVRGCAHSESGGRGSTEARPAGPREEAEDFRATDSGIPAMRFDASIH